MKTVPMSATEVPTGRSRRRVWVSAWLRRFWRPYSLWNQVWNIDTEARYSAARRALEGIPPDSICEVGPGNCGIGFALKRPILGIDIAFNHHVLSAANPFVIAVVGTCTQLPLADGAVEGSLSLDSLEHVPRGWRFHALRELLRVARRRAVISVPNGDAAAQCDAQLFAAYSRRYGRGRFWLTEHMEFGVPTESETLEMLNRAAHTLSLRVRIRTELHMPTRVHDVNHRILMIGNYRFARLLSWPLRGLRPLLELWPSPDHYRLFFIVDIEAGRTT